MITLSTADVNKTFKQVNTHKAKLPGHVLRACADQLASVFTDIFNISLSESVIPTCYKQTTIVPVPKNTKVTCLNDYFHDVAMLGEVYDLPINTFLPFSLHSTERTLGKPFVNIERVWPPEWGSG